MLENLEPKSVFQFFEEISRIPRGSGNEKAISDYMVKFANDRQLLVIQDEAMNVIIRKPGSKGNENAPTVSLQGHLDMVNEKNKDCEHDFDRDPLKLIIDGDRLKADGTTLGGDNGIAVAYCMALLDDNTLTHPPLECIFTTCEETGLDGAKALAADCITGSVLINIDSEEEGIFLASCAGGIRQSVSLKTSVQDVPENHDIYIITVSGLFGGHSGMDINKGRGNANVLLGRVLNRLYRDCMIYISAINGGMKDNAIPREAEAAVAVPNESNEQFMAIIQEFSKIFKNEFRSGDPGVTLKAEKAGFVNKVWNEATCEKVIAALTLVPNGVQSMSMDIEGLVESSTNLGVVETNEEAGIVNITNALRSSVASKKQAMVEKIQMVSEIIRAEVSTRGDYPSWEYAKESRIRDIFVKTYKEVTGADAKIDAIHAGLECGLFAEKRPGLDMVSFGPNLYDVHTPQESMSISSVQRTWDLLKAVLVNMCGL